MENFDANLLAEVKTVMPKITTLIAYNSTDQTASFYLTLGKNTKGCIQDVKEVFEPSGFTWSYTSNSHSQGVVQIPAKQWLKYTPPAHLGLHGDFTINEIPKIFTEPALSANNRVGEIYMNAKLTGLDDTPISYVNGVDSTFEYQMLNGRGKWGVQHATLYMTKFANPVDDKKNYPTRFSIAENGTKKEGEVFPHTNETRTDELKHSGKGGYVIVSYLGTPTTSC